MVPILMAAAVLSAIRAIEKFTTEVSIGQEYTKQRKRGVPFKIVGIAVQEKGSCYAALTEEEIDELLQSELITRGARRVDLININAAIQHTASQA